MHRSCDLTLSCSDPRTQLVTTESLKGAYASLARSTSTDDIRSHDDAHTSGDDDGDDDENIAEHERKVEELRRALKAALKDL